MKIKSIDITSFGGLKNQSLKFSDNINLVFGENGSGKSTVMNFIKLMFYSKTENERSSDISKSLRKKTKPLDGSPQIGRITLSHDGCDYLIEKKFGRTSGSDETTIINLSNGEHVALGAGKEPGEYFTGLSLAQFERCCYMLSGDFAKLESELSDIKEFSSSDEAVKSSYPSTVFSKLNKMKELYISKSRKKGLIIEKEEELSRVDAELSKSLENERISGELDAEFNILRSESEVLNKKLMKSEDAEKQASALKSILKLYELKKSIVRTNDRLSVLNLDEQGMNEFISLGDIMLQNTLSRQKIYIEAKNRHDPHEFQKITDLKEKAQKLSDCIKNIKEQIIKLEEQKKSIEKKLPKYRNSICISVCLMLLSFALTAIFFLSKNTLSLAAACAVLPVFLFSLLKCIKYKKEIYSGKTSNLTNTEIKLGEAKKELDRYETELNNLLDESNTEDVSGLAEKYYKLKAELDGSDAEKLKTSVLESIKEFISHVSIFSQADSFEEAKQSFDTIKELYSEKKALNSEYLNLLELTENKDRSLLEYETVINRLRSSLSAAEVFKPEEKSAVKHRIDIISEELLRIKSKYPKNSKSVYELERYKEKLKAELSELNDTYSSLLMAEEVLKESCNEISHGFIPQINKIASSILSELEDNPESEIIVTDKVTPKVKKDMAGEFVHSGYMSESENERIYFALRLAIISVIDAENSKLPLLADDIFSSYDSGFKEKAIRYLKKFSKERQVIFFTCHESSKKLFEAYDEELSEIILTRA